MVGILTAESGRKTGSKSYNLALCRPMNRRRIWVVLAPIVLFAALAVCIQTEVMTRFEDWTYRAAVGNYPPSLTTALKGLTHLGDTVVLFSFCLILIFVPKTRRTIALPVSSAVIASAILNVVLKHLFARSRPDILRLISETGYSFPSSHAMNNAAFYTLLILLIWRYTQKTSMKIIFSVIGVALTALIGYSRVYLGVHYAGDVLGGWLFGFALAVLIYFLWDKRLPKHEAK